jgi:hypothetical protein
MESYTVEVSSTAIPENTRTAAKKMVAFAAGKLNLGYISLRWYEREDGAPAGYVSSKDTGIINIQAGLDPSSTASIAAHECYHLSQNQAGGDFKSEPDAEKFAAWAISQDWKGTDVAEYAVEPKAHIDIEFANACRLRNRLQASGYSVNRYAEIRIKELESNKPGSRYLLEKSQKAFEKAHKEYNENNYKLECFVKSEMLSSREKKVVDTGNQYLTKLILGF